jgi:hypothetical protein
MNETYSASTLVSNLSLGKVYQIPLCLKNGTPFYINNTIGTRTYIKIIFKNLRNETKNILFGLFNLASRDQEETLLSTNSLTLYPFQTTSAYVFNNVKSGNDHLTLRAISGFNYDDSLKLE